MKNYFLILVLSIAWSCTTKSQSLNKEITKKDQKPYLLGKIDKTGLTSNNYNNWFLSQFNDYQLNDTVISKISKNLSKYKIVAFMGTWCGDSRREVPRFYKILEAANFPMNRLMMVAVNREPGMYKQSPDHEEKGLNIHRVPTFIFYKNKKEVNRIVEYPVQSLEEDMLSIIEGDYQSNYHLVTEINAIINDKDFYQKTLKSIKVYKKKVKNMYELNTYAKVLISNKNSDGALDVLKLNTQLFSEHPEAYINLANLYHKLNEQKRALTNYEKALKLNPSNQRVKNMIEKIKDGI